MAIYDNWDWQDKKDWLDFRVDPTTVEWLQGSGRFRTRFNCSFNPSPAISHTDGALIVFPLTTLFGRASTPQESICDLFSKVVNLGSYVTTVDSEDALLLGRICRHVIDPETLTITYSYPYRRSFEEVFSQSKVKPQPIAYLARPRPYRKRPKATDTPHPV